VGSDESPSAGDENMFLLHRHRLSHPSISVSGLLYA
jgi:hypothetical protein